MRHKADSGVYQKYYHNSRMNAVVQDACYGLKRRGLERPQEWARTFAGLCADFFFLFFFFFLFNAVRTHA